MSVSSSKVVPAVQSALPIRGEPVTSAAGAEGTRRYRVYRRIERLFVGALVWLPSASFAHAIALAGLRVAPKIVPAPPPDDPILRTNAFDFDLPNPLGTAAGLDKNGFAVDGALYLGAGFVEIGTVTPERQKPNSGRKVFRLRGDRSVINRFGFNSRGGARVHRYLERQDRSGLLGINIGANRNSEDRIDDFVQGVRCFHDLANYLTINVSSPNTKGLRDLQTGALLDELLDRVCGASTRLSNKPLFLKIAPDLSDDQLLSIFSTIAQYPIAALVVGNTTVSRPSSLKRGHSKPGGLSGRALFPLSTRVLAFAYVHLHGRIPLIGAGGVEDANTAFLKVQAGASLVQLYTSMIFNGFSSLTDIKSGLADKLKALGMANVQEAVGMRAKEIAGL